MVLRSEQKKVFFASQNCGSVSCNQEPLGNAFPGFAFLVIFYFFALLKGLLGNICYFF